MFSACPRKQTLRGAAGHVRFALKATLSWLDGNCELPATDS
jgi:hypothetical protein